MITALEKKAWGIYCEDTIDNMHVADFWWKLPERVQKVYLWLAGDIERD